MRKSFVKSFFSLFLIVSFTLNSFAATIYSPGANSFSEPSPISSTEGEITPISNTTKTLDQATANKISQLVMNDGTPVIKAPSGNNSSQETPISVTYNNGLLGNGSDNGPITSMENAGPTNYLQVNVSTPVPNISAPAYIIVNATTKQIYASKDQDGLYEPAGLANLMTAYLGINYKNLNDTLTCSYDAWHTVDSDASIAGLKTGDKITLNDAIASMFVKSCADSANVIGEAVSGKISTFVDVMNNTAKAIGCQNTNFTNTSGLNNDNQKSTAYDLMLIMDKVTENPELVNLLSLTQYTLPETQKRDKLILFSKNSALIKNGAHYNADLACSRLGYTSKSGYTMASMCNYQGNRFIAIVLKTKGSQFEDTKKLINFAKLCYEETK